uniref:Uncharacterized protein n=1 Tax=Timema tahoe TaxID=61484 RepID=A0A7R9IAN7_9NEOP|nr:unnamed protein product [Timema tahoe]
MLTVRNYVRYYYEGWTLASAVLRLKEHSPDLQYEVFTGVPISSPTSHAHAGSVTAKQGRWTLLISGACGVTQGDVTQWYRCGIMQGVGLIPGEHWFDNRSRHFFHVANLKLDEGLTVYDGVESIDGVRSVLDGTDVAVGLHQTVAAVDDVSVPRLVLGLAVAGKGVVDAVREAVLGIGVWVVRGGVGGVGRRHVRGGGCVGGGGGVARGVAGIAGVATVCDGHQSREGVRIHTGVTTYTSREVMSPHVSSRPHALSQYLRQHIFREP